MKEQQLIELLTQVKEGRRDIQDALEDLKVLPFQDLGYAKVDHHRGIRNGYPEVIYCEGKAPSHVLGIIENMVEKGSNVLATRADLELWEVISGIYLQAEYHKLARIITIKQNPIPVSDATILVMTAGTSDISVAEEAAITAEMLGSKVTRLYDVGVAGIHRLLAHMPLLQEASVIVTVAGMEGALASVVGGLVDIPVIAVPTSIGYGANFGGLSALLTMLNSCASGIGVVNIDNGFGGGYLASTIVRQIEKGRS